MERDNTVVKIRMLVELSSTAKTENGLLGISTDPVGLADALLTCAIWSNALSAGGVVDADCEVDEILVGALEEALFRQGGGGGVRKITVFS